MWRLSSLFFLLGLAAAGPARADEGMWLLNDFPADKVQASYGFKPDAAWLDHARLAAIRLANGCSASLVSPTGLVATNHHCVRECLTQISARGNDTSALGFLAQTEAEEKKCDGTEADRLLEITSVTDRINKATEGKEGADFAAALKAEIAAITQACAGGDDKLRCDVVTLYRGGRYDLYKYRRYQDVRLVFAPEDEIADFGGDPDNFEFPRYDLDVGFLRLYDNGKPLDSKDGYFHFGEREPESGELAFSIGNPGSTERLDTVAQIEEERDVEIPRLLLYLTEERGLLTEFVHRGPEQRRVGEASLLNIENAVKEFRGVWQALREPALIEGKQRAETALREKVSADPSLAKNTGSAWDDIAGAIQRHRAIDDRVFALGLVDRASRLLADAVILVRAPVEQAKPDGERLREYTKASFPALRQRVLATFPMAPDLETIKLGYALGKLREILGPDDPAVHKLLGKQAPEQLAALLVKGTKLGDIALRKKLLEGGATLVDASPDPMIAFARLLDEEIRPVRRQTEDEYDSVLDAAGGKIARAALAVYGSDTYPDATFTLRVSYGSVTGWNEKGRSIPPFTRFSGLFERATGADPFRLPDRWKTAEKQLDPGTVFDFTTTNDIVGGNSGSPVIDSNGNVLGLAFDGNIDSLGGDFGYDGAVNRCVSVSAVAIREALAKIYGANSLLDELGTATH
jgi:Peptidase S46